MAGTTIALEIITTERHSNDVRQTSITVPTQPHDPLDIENHPAPDNNTTTTSPRWKTTANMIALIASLFVSALDQTILATAAPTISAELGSGAGFAWIAGSYLLATAVAGPIIVKASDIWGRRPLMLGSVAMFFASSLICALAGNMAMLLAGRALQGAAGGGMLTLVAVIISDLFSPRQRATYFTIMEVMWAVASAAGPLLGGVFASKLSWRYCFWINLPITGIAFIMLFTSLKTHQPGTGIREGIKALDRAGTICLLATTLLLLLGLDMGGEVLPWNNRTILCLIVFGGVAGVLLVVSEKKIARYPLMPMHLFANRSNCASLLVGISQSFVSVGCAYYIPLFFQSVKSASPLQSGIWTLSFTVVDAAAAVSAGIFLATTADFKRLICFGTAFLCLGSGLLLLIHADSSIALAIGIQVLPAIGVGCLFQPVLLAVQAHTAQAHVATATATLGFVKTIASSVSVVIAGILFSNGMASHAAGLRSSGVDPSLVSIICGPDAAASITLLADVTDPMHRYAIQSAYAASLRNVWLLLLSVGGLGCIAAFFVQKKPLSTHHKETKTGLPSTA